jgi:hypothetical protein
VFFFHSTENPQTSVFIFVSKFFFIEAKKNEILWATFPSVAHDNSRCLGNISTVACANTLANSFANSSTDGRTYTPSHSTTKFITHSKTN